MRTTSYKRKLRKSANSLDMFAAIPVPEINLGYYLKVASQKAVW